MSQPKDLPGEAEGLLIDPSVTGQSHLLVNTGIARLVLARYRRLTIIAEEGHCAALAQYLGAADCERITFIPWQDRFTVHKVVRKFVAGRQFDQIIFTNLEYKIFAHMHLFHQRASRKPILWVLHSHLVDAAATGRAARIKNLLKWTLLFRMFPRAKLVVLGHRVRANIETLIGRVFRRGNIASIIHPIGVARLPDRDAPLSAAPPRAIFISGWHAMPPENRHILERLEEVPPEDRRFEIVALSTRFQGREGYRSFSMEYSDRLNHIAEADFFLHLPSDAYRLQASGAVMDMLVTGTPMIGLRTDFGDEIEGLIGPFGYFFDNREDLLRFLLSAEIDPAEVARFRANLAKGHGTILALSQKQFDDLRNA